MFPKDFMHSYSTRLSLILLEAWKRYHHLDDTSLLPVDFQHIQEHN